MGAATGYSLGGGVRPNEQFGYKYDAVGNLLSRTNYDGRVNWTFSNKNQPDSASRNSAVTVAARTTSSGQNVATTIQTATINGAGVTPNSDGSFAKTNVTVVDGNNTFTASATDALGRTSSATSTVYLPANITYAYGTDGNMTFDGRLNFGWDDEGQLTAITNSAAWRTEFVYDGLKRLWIRREYARVGASWTGTNEVRYVYDGNLPTQERHYNPQLTLAMPQQVISYTRSRDLSGSLEGAGGIGGLLARTDHSPLITGHSFYHSDHLGNITTLVNSRETVVGRYRYDPYGNILGIEGSAAEANTMRYASKEWHRNSEKNAKGHTDC